MASLGVIFVWLSVCIAMWTGSVQSGELPTLQDAQMQTPAHTVVTGPVKETGAPEPASIARWPSRLQTKGNRIVNAAGEIVHLKGLMIPDPAKVAGEGRYARRLFETLRATGANVVRIPVHPQHWAKDPDYVHHHLDPAVRWAGELGMYVILDWHSIGNVLTGYAPQVPELFCHTEAMTADFWERVAAHFKDAPHVIFEIFNEPQNISAADWRRCANRLVRVIRAQRARLMSYLADRGVGWVACWFDGQWQPAMLLPGGHGYTSWGEFATRELRKSR